MEKIRKIIIGSDHAGFALKEDLRAYLIKKGIKVDDAGAYSDERCDYPVFASKVAGEVSRGRHKRGVLICKSGIGNAITANKFSNVRAALCYNVKAARLSREHNDSNILVLGAAFVNKKTAKRILGVWLETGFLGGRHRRRLNKIREIEKELRI